MPCGADQAGFVPKRRPEPTIGRRKQDKSPQKAFSCFLRAIRPRMTKTSSAVRFARPEASQRVGFLKSASSCPKLSPNTEKLAHGEIPNHNSALEHFMCGKIPASSARERFGSAVPGRKRVDFGPIRGVCLLGNKQCRDLVAASWSHRMMTALAPFFDLNVSDLECKS